MEDGEYQTYLPFEPTQSDLKSKLDLTVSEYKTCPPDKRFNNVDSRPVPVLSPFYLLKLHWNTGRLLTRLPSRISIPSGSAMKFRRVLFISTSRCWENRKARTLIGLICFRVGGAVEGARKRDWNASEGSSCIKEKNRQMFLGVVSVFALMSICVAVVNE